MIINLKIGKYTLFNEGLTNNLIPSLVNLTQELRIYAESLNLAGKEKTF